MIRVNLNKVAEEKEKIRDRSKPYEYTTATNLFMQFLVLQFDRSNRPYKIFPLGAGIKKITSETDTCPCCKQKLGGIK